MALPGVQVLFAFLLVVPFNQRFPSITEFQKTTYFVTLLLTAAASVCLIAPTVQHRIEFRAQDKERILMTSNRLAILGMGFLALAMTGAIMLITDMLYGSTVTIVATRGPGDRLRAAVVPDAAAAAAPAAVRGLSAGSGPARAPARGRRRPRA